MGNSISRQTISRLGNEINDKNNVIGKQHDIIDKQNKIIDILKCKSSLNYCVKDGIVQKNDDFLSHLRIVKKEKKYEYIVFSGGGVKGLAFCGAMDVLGDYGILACTEHPDRQIYLKGYAGASAGSIAASLLALGYTTSVIKDILMKLDMNRIVDDKWGVVRDGVNFLKDYGVVPGNFLYEFLGKLVKDKTGDPDYTIDQLYKDKGIKLVIVITDMNNKCPIYLYPEHKDEAYRNMSIRKAVRISTGIPFLFEPIICNGNYCVDGGVLDNYPLHVFDGEYPGEISARLNAVQPNPQVIGLNIVSGEEKLYTYTDRTDIDNIVDYTTSFITTLLADNQRKILLPSYWHRTININTPNYPGTKFDFNDKQKLELIEDGKESAKEFFAEN